MEALPHFTSFDIGVLTLAALLIGRGIWVGFIKQLASIVALLAGFITAGRLHEDFYQAILPFLSDTSIAFIISYLGLFVVIYIAVILLGLGLKKVVDIALLGWFDRLVGGVIGAAKAVFIASLVFMILANVLSGSNTFLRNSLLYPYLSASSEYILKLVRDADLRSSFTPKEPAIQEELPPVENPKEKIKADQPASNSSDTAL